MRRDHATWAVRLGVVVSLPSYRHSIPKDRTPTRRRIERRGVHRIPSREP